MEFKLLFKHSFEVLVVVLTTVIGLSAAHGQTSSFTYQGRLTDGGTAANGNYDLQFGLWDSVSGGSQIGSTQTLNAVAVSNGTFSVSLDFGANSFPGANRFLEISARPSGAGSFTTLSPRQQVTSTPYAVRSVSAGNADTATNATVATNATQLGGVAAGQYVQTNDSRLTDARPPTPGSPNYIQTNPGSTQNGSFFVSGDGFAGGILSGGTVNTATQYNVGGVRALSFNNRNSFVGISTGLNNTTGVDNSFVGQSAGVSNTAGVANSFFGSNTGINIKSGNANVFLGFLSGSANTNGSANVFIGGTVGSNGEGSTTGYSNVTGDYNTAIGSAADVGDAGAGISDLTNATAIGAHAQVRASNSLVLGSINGVNSATADTNVGIGTTVPLKRFEVKTLTVADGIDLAGTAPAYFLSDATKAEKGALGFAGQANLYSVDAAAGDIVLRSLTGRLLLQHGAGGAGLILTSSGTVAIPNLGSGGSTSLCRNSSNEISTCSSSLRYKTNVQTFHGGLELINRLRPITFTWKQNGAKDLGLGAEEVEQIEPLLTFRNDKGEVEGVKYGQLNIVLINAVKEQQAQIQEQQEQLREQRNQLAALKKLVCRSHRSVGVCR